MRCADQWLQLPNGERWPRRCGRVTCAPCMRWRHQERVAARAGWGRCAVLLAVYSPRHSDVSNLDDEVRS